MSASPATVRCLRLRARRREHIGRGALLVEDALRMASSPGGRLVLVRRLDLGRFHATASSSTLALIVADHLRRVSFEAVHGASQGAAEAGAVWFSDRSEARALAAWRLLDGGRLDAWHWPIALPECAVRAEPEVALRALLLAPAAGPAALVELRAVWARLAAAGRLEAAFAHVGVADARAALHRWCGADAGGDAVAPAPRASFDALLAPWRAALLRCAAQGVDEARVVWLGALALAVRDPGRSEDFRLARAGRALAAAAVAIAARAPLAEPSEAEGGIDGKPRLGARDGGPIEPPSPALTTCAGALFLLHALRRLSVEVLLEREPEWQERGLVPRILASAARRTGATAEDPLVKWLEARSDATYDLAFERRVRTWLVAIARFVRRATAAAPAEAADAIGARGLTLRELVRRRGRFLASATHLDLWLPLEEVDLRVRRAGLDLDPDWYAPIGRVVAFHFTPGARIGSSYGRGDGPRGGRS